MKKIISLLLITLTLLMMSGCGKKLDVSYNVNTAGETITITIKNNGSDINSFEADVNIWPSKSHKGEPIGTSHITFGGILKKGETVRIDVVCAGDTVVESSGSRTSSTTDEAGNLLYEWESTYAYCTIHDVGDVEVNISNIK